MKKRSYITPELDVIYFEITDIIATSSTGNETTPGGGIVLPDDSWN